jgi:hypothetical protein
MNANPTPAEFAAECEVVINQLSPELDYRRADLYGFVTGCWPTEDCPADVAAQFVESLNEN